MTGLTERNGSGELMGMLSALPIKAWSRGTRAMVADSLDMMFV